MEGTIQSRLPRATRLPAGLLRTETDSGPGKARLWISLGCLGVFLFWQAWMTVRLFGAESGFGRLLDATPIVSGRHPLHLYHGFLGAQAFLERWTFCCYDPAFQAGYPKTPVYDSGSRPAELFLTIVGGEYSPQAYKIGIFLVCLLVPLLIWLSAAQVGMDGASRVLAVALGLLVWWGGPAQALLDAGDLDLLIASVLLLSHASFLARFDQSPSMRSWLGMLVTATLTWFAHPLLALIFAPIWFGYYLAVGAHHTLAWHITLIGAQVIAFLVNGFWLFQWLQYWWILSPLRMDEPFLAHRTLRLILSSSHWGDGFDRGLTAILFLAGTLGAIAWNQAGRKATARLLGCGCLLFLLLSVVGVVWEPLTRWSAHRLLLPALLFAVLPAAKAISSLFAKTVRLGPEGRRGALVAAVPIVGVALLLVGFRQEVGKRFYRPSPFALGFTESQETLIDALCRHTDPQARILLENDGVAEQGTQWASLLPLVTGRAYVGGLDPEASIEHTYASFVNQELAGKPIDTWQDSELSSFVRRYNLGWVACRTGPATRRFQQWRDAEQIAGPNEAGGATLFRLKPRSFILQGRARTLWANSRGIALADVVPEDGKLVLSWHYQKGMRVSPGRIQIEKDPDPADPIPFIRLNVQEPVARLVIWWQEP